MNEGQKVLWAISAITLSFIFIWLLFYTRGKRFALRDKLQKVDAIVVLAGTRGNVEFLHKKVETAARLYRDGWAKHIICGGKFSAKVTDSPQLMSQEELRLAVDQGRIQEKDIARAAATWDIALGARYMRDKAMAYGVPDDAIVLEEESLHTRETAEYVLDIVQKHKWYKIILVTSPFHQLRTYLTFAKVFLPYDIQISNYYADSDSWHPMAWFLSKSNRELLDSEMKRIQMYRAKGDLL
ncbi:YdcF family protein [Ktedonobacter racemifer]|uniref:DUF218 domain-containing protein n=1 Tax=Ktedonobacter racemifer DSM 44963 TaxID=485913 RepID=D6TQ41_KTERA|nr:YdcF family protein [Ktedonobacter racemifer]EFH85689.1 protein of unknown function DUF218 [Ktedonobacter racemifer DSM 44963]